LWPCYDMIWENLRLWEDCLPLFFVHKPNPIALITPLVMSVYRFFLHRCLHYSIDNMWLNFYAKLVGCGHATTWISSSHVFEHTNKISQIRYHMIRYTGLAFETPSRVPKLPTLDKLSNHGTTAFLKWLEAQNPRIGHDNFRAQTKEFTGTWKYFRMAHQFPRTVNKFPRMVSKFSRKVNKFPWLDLIFPRKQKYLRTHLNVWGHK